ncbi:MAG: 1-acyl-sn-glycerol-3-phosphate acyltransferase [Turicibacter sp.]|nr:1-acyl-sn-glycerol-3-phosphate acyltransferase [Turicibacter sp.]
MEKPTYPRPNAIIYFLIYVLIYPFLKLCFGLRVDKSQFKLPKGPCIVLCNHTSFMDFALAMLPLYPRRLNAVAAQKFFYYKPLNWFLPLMGCIPKNLFDSDLRSIMSMMNVVKDGGSLLLFPEGRCSVDGKFMGMHKAAGKLAKRLEVPVVACYIEGAYECMPFWRPGLRFGRLKVTLTNLFDGPALKALPVDDINERIQSALTGKNAPPLINKGTFFANNLAVGLENLLYLCPKCHQEYTLQSTGNVISCKNCGKLGLVRNDLSLEPIGNSQIPPTIQKWYHLCIAHEMGRLSKGMPPITVGVNLRMHQKPGEGLEPCGTGILALGETGWDFTGEINGQPAQIHYPLKTVAAIPFDPNDNFQIYSGGNLYAFTPTTNPQACSQYATLGECAYWKFSPKLMMTSGDGGGFGATVKEPS